MALGRNEAEHLALDVVLACLDQLLADVFGDGTDVAHDHIDIWEDVFVDTLQYVVGLSGLGCNDLEGVVDETCTEGLDFRYGAFHVEF